MSRILLLLLVLFSVTTFAQVDPDSVQSPRQDTLPIPKEKTDTTIRKQPTVTITEVDDIMADSFSRKPVIKDTGWAIEGTVPLSMQVLQRHPYFGFSSKPVHHAPIVHRGGGKELLFYVIIGLLLFFAFLRQVFGRYFENLFRLFFRTTLKYRQIREQLMQTPLPSLLLNAFFVISGGFYISFLLIHFKLIDNSEFWRYVLYSCIGLSAIYFVKFLGLKVIGWIFNLRDAADSYIFIVFVINKVIGVFLLPFIVMLAFMTGQGYTVALVVSWFGIGALVLYRYILSYAAVRNQVKFNPFHFFLYLLAFEIAPLLLIYKLLLVFFQ